MDTQLSDEQMDHSEVVVETGGLHGKIELEDLHGVRVDVELNMKETLKQAGKIQKSVFMIWGQEGLK